MTLTLILFGSNMGLGALNKIFLYLYPFLISMMQTVSQTVYSENQLYTFYCIIELFGIFLLLYLLNFIKEIFLIINISIFELIILIDCKSLFTKEQKQGLFY